MPKDFDRRMQKLYGDLLKRKEVDIPRLYRAEVRSPMSPLINSDSADEGTYVPRAGGCRLCSFGYGSQTVSNIGCSSLKSR